MSIAADLRGSVKTSRVLDAPAELRTYAYDASFLTQLAPRAPDAVVIAESTEDVSAVMRYANARQIPVTPRGAASGQAAGAVALGVASYEGLHSKSFVNDANASFNANQGAYRPQDLATIDSAKSASSLANVLFIAGGVLAATGLTMVFAF